MAVISTGLGFTTSSGSLSQKACIPADAKKLRFRWNLNSEEFLEYCFSQFQDFFSVTAQPQAGANSQLLRTQVSELCSAGGLIPVGFSFDQGGVYTTGWRSQEIDVSALAAANAGKPITFTFAAGDVGDSIYDTAVLIDKIEIVK